MNVSTSEYSSECESGWTTYLDQLSNSTDHHNNHFVTEYDGKKDIQEEDRDDDIEDLSMVSDASSGPPHFHEYDETINSSGGGGGGGVGGGGVYSQYYGYYTPDQEKKKSSNIKVQKNKIKETNNNNNNIRALDDTASSPFFGFSQDNVGPSDFSRVFSSAQFEGGASMTKKHLGFFKSSTKGQSGGWRGKKRQ